jgi:hypothetical protein
MPHPPKIFTLPKPPLSPKQARYPGKSNKAVSPLACHVLSRKHPSSTFCRLHLALSIRHLHLALSICRLHLALSIRNVISTEGGVFCRRSGETPVFRRCLVPLPVLLFVLLSPLPALLFVIPQRSGGPVVCPAVCPVVFLCLPFYLSSRSEAEGSAVALACPIRRHRRNQRQTLASGQILRDPPSKSLP